MQQYIITINNKRKMITLFKILEIRIWSIVDAGQKQLWDFHIRKAKAYATCHDMKKNW